MSNKLNFTINGHPLVRAANCEGWAMSLFGQPKMTIVCGECMGTFKTRDYHKVLKKGTPIGSFAKCSCCGMLNFFDMYLD
jgi:hypothetical protein